MPISNIKSPVDLFNEAMVQAITTIKADTENHIHTAISANSQTNAGLGLLPQEQTDCIKAQVTIAMTENDTFKAEVSVLTTIAEIDAYLVNITRTALDTCRPVGV